MTIKLINYYIENTIDILELFVAINGCLFASVILGLTLLEQTKQSHPDIRYINVLFDILHTGRNILFYYGKFSATSERYGKSVDKMLAALSDTQQILYTKRTPESTLNSDQSHFEEFYKEIISLENEEVSLNNLMNFQQTFIPSINDDDSDNFMFDEDFVSLNNNIYH